MKQSAGILLFKQTSQGLTVLIVHPGGPFWSKRDSGAWSIPKGEFIDGEDPLVAAKREFIEEMGKPVPEGSCINLGSSKQPSGKIVHIWALESDFDDSDVNSNKFTMEWPPRSGQKQEFPEVDRAKWYPISKAKIKIVKGQTVFLDKLETYLGEKQAQSSQQATLFC
jgi:predicted NUDIX family NTP pyrophosphohydrolase